MAPTVVTTDNQKEGFPIDYHNDDDIGTMIIDHSLENYTAGINRNNEKKISACLNSGNLSVPDPLDNGIVVTTMNNNNHMPSTSLYSTQYYSERSSYNHCVSYDRFNNIQV